MSEDLKVEIAKELGVYEQVKQDGGWQNVSSKNCGNIVKKAIEIANRKVQLCINCVIKNVVVVLYGYSIYSYNTTATFFIVIVIV